jgi:nitrogen fixation protein NifU and related proteins
MDDLYHQQILEHYQAPHHFGVLDNADHHHEEANHSCGDVFTFYLATDEHKSKIENLSFMGVGCAISTAASSLLLDHLKGKSISEIKTLDQTFMQDLIGAEISTTRLKCLMLPARALEKLIHAAR